VAPDSRLAKAFTRLAATWPTQQSHRGPIPASTR
jgi:hypothetical protein